MTGKQIYESKERSCKWEELLEAFQEVWEEIFSSTTNISYPKYFFVGWLSSVGDKYNHQADQIVDLMNAIYELERKENESK